MVNDFSLLCNAILKSKHSSPDTISGYVPDFSFEFKGYGIIYEPGEVLYGSKQTVKIISLSQLDKFSFCIVSEIVYVRK